MRFRQTFHRRAAALHALLIVALAAGAPVAHADDVELVERVTFTTGAKWFQMDFQLTEPTYLGIRVAGAVQQGDALFGGWLGALVRHNDDGSKSWLTVRGYTAYVNAVTPEAHVWDTGTGVDIDAAAPHSGVNVPFVAPLDGYEGVGSASYATRAAGNYTFYGFAATDGTFRVDFDLEAEAGSVHDLEVRTGDGFLYLNQDFQGDRNVHVLTPGTTADTHIIENGELELETSERTHFWFGTFNGPPDADVWFEAPDHVEEGYSWYWWLNDLPGNYTYHVDREFSIEVNAGCGWHTYNEQLSPIHVNPERECGSPAVWLFGFVGDLTADN